MFTFHAQAYSSSDNGDLYTVIEIKVNGLSVAAAVLRDYNGTSVKMISQTVIESLSPGDLVWINISAGLYGSPKEVAYTHFTGHLLHSLE